jgi:monoamine oxidase
VQSRYFIANISVCRSLPSDQFQVKNSTSKRQLSGNQHPKSANYAVIIIGGGICGLTIASEISKKKKVLLLEARKRLGGRIHSLKGAFSETIDEGAEFIHGKSPHTKKLVKKSGAHEIVPDGKFYLSHEGTFSEAEEMDELIGPALEKLKSMKKDMSFSEFLKKYFDKAEEETVERLRSMAQGFDAADVKKLSAFSVRDEWSDSFDSSAFISGGHSRLVEHLEERCLKNGCHIRFPAEVKKVSWKNKEVRVVCADGTAYAAEKVVVTVPLGVLTSKKSDVAHIQFQPPLPEIKAAAKMMGYGPVIKVIFEFRETFWARSDFDKQSAFLPDMLFLFSEGKFPTWWTPIPGHPFLTGWAGGPDARKFRKMDEAQILKSAIDSFIEALHLTRKFFDRQLVASHVKNWGTDPYALGAYSYRTVDFPLALKVLSRPVADTLYFAGEAIEKNGGGTVESAISSGLNVAGKIT